MPMVVDMNKPHFLGNMYGLHDGYDGSVFDPNTIAKTVIASVGGVSLIPEQEAIPSEKFVGIKQATKGGSVPCVIGGWQT